MFTAALLNNYLRSRCVFAMSMGMKLEHVQRTNALRVHCIYQMHADLSGLTFRFVIYKPRFNPTATLDCCQEVGFSCFQDSSLVAHLAALPVGEFYVIKPAHPLAATARLDELAISIGNLSPGKSMII